MSLPEPPLPDRAAWTARVRAELDGRDPAQVLGTLSEDGLAVRPLYTAEGASPTDPLPGSDAPTGPLPWAIDAAYAGPGAASAMPEDVLGGVTGLRIDPTACGLTSSEELAAALPEGAADVELRGPAFAPWLDRLDVAGAVLCDADAPELPPLLAEGRRISLSSEPWAEAGATGPQEVGWLLAAGLRAVRIGAEGGLNLRVAAARIRLTLCVGREVFPSIARLRALRSLWSRALAAWGLPDAPLELRATTHPGHLSVRGPWLNLLRGSHGAFAAIVGGADRLEVLPFDAALGQPDALGRRMARNTPQILGLESHLGRVRDPGAGSWFLEDLTARTAEAAWAELQAVGGDLGLVEAIARGTLDRACRDAWAHRREAIARRTLPITGVSEFPDPEDPPERPGEPRPTLHRDAAPWEALHGRVQAAGWRVFLATWGPRAEWNARATWAENLLRAGGFDVVRRPPGEVEDLGAAFEAGGAHAACLCAADARWEEAPGVADALRRAGARAVLIAGRGEGADATLRRGDDVLGALTDLASALEANR